MVRAIANGSQSPRLGMLLGIDFGRILDQQHRVLLTAVLPRGLLMWPHQVFIADVGRVRKAVGRLQSGCIMHLFGQGGCWLPGQRLGRADGTPRASRISQLRPTKGGLGPQLRRQQNRCWHHLLFPFWLSSSSMILSSVVDQTCDKKSGTPAGEDPCTPFP
jgi:hypothetical protein